MSYFDYFDINVIRKSPYKMLTSSLVLQIFREIDRYASFREIVFQLPQGIDLNEFVVWVIVNHNLDANDLEVVNLERSNSYC